MITIGNIYKYDTQIPYQKVILNILYNKCIESEYHEDYKCNMSDSTVRYHYLAIKEIISDEKLDVSGSLQELGDSAQEAPMERATSSRQQDKEDIHIAGRMLVTEKEDKIIIDNISTSEKFKGVGKLMIEYLKKEAYKKNKNIELYPDYRIRGYYEKLGFIKITSRFGVMVWDYNLERGYNRCIADDNTLLKIK